MRRWLLLNSERGHEGQASAIYTMRKALFLIILVESISVVFSAIPTVLSKAFVGQDTHILIAESNSSDTWRRHSHRPESLVILSISPYEAECSWLGRRIVSLLKREDVDTAQTFNRFYTMFGCPTVHLGKVFGCVVAFDADHEDVEERIKQCWSDPHYGRSSIQKNR